MNIAQYTFNIGVFSFVIIQMLVKNHYFCCISKNFSDSMFYVVFPEDIRRHLL